jgi:hypothetical protein
MFKSKEAFPNGAGFSTTGLSAEDLFVMQREQIFDWMVSNHDTHTGQWIRLEDGQLFGIDKGQAFKFFPNDKLDWDYVPVTPLGGDKLTYSRLWKDYIAGKNVAMQDPTQGELGAYIDRLMAISDAEYRKLLEPYATARVAQFGGDAKKFLDQAVARKNNLKSDFEDFWARAQVERAKHVPTSPPLTPTPTPTPAVAPVTFGAPTPVGSLGDTSGFDFFAKQDIVDAWTAANGGKKVTPVWGGKKVWDNLLKTKAQLNKDYAKAGLTPPNHLQILRILDEDYDSATKNKSYEGVLLDWVETPNGKKAVFQYGALPKSLDKNALPTPSVSTPGVSTPMVSGPIISPTAAQVTDEANDIITSAAKIKMSHSAAHADVITGNLGDVVGYAEAGSQQYMLKKTSMNSYTIFKRDAPGKQAPGLAWDPSWKFYITGKTKADLSGFDWYKNTAPVSTVKVASKIPGKGPGDNASLSELIASKNLWAENDVIATKTVGTSKIELISDGHGNVTMWMKGQHDSNFSKLSLGSGDPWQKLIDIGADNGELKLGPDVLIGTKKAAVPFAKAGDPLSVGEVMSAPPNMTIAYGVDPTSTSTDGLLYKIVDDTGQKNVYFKNFSDAHWLYLTDPNTPADLDYALTNVFGTKAKLYAANADGSMPDVVKLQIPGAGTRLPVKTQANPKGFYIGDTMTHDQIMESIYDNPVPGSVIAEGTSSSGTQWKIVYETDDQLHAKFVDFGGDIIDGGVVNDATEIPTVTGWKASDQLIEPMKPVPLATSIPGKSAGDVVNAYDIWPVVDVAPNENPIAYTFDDVHGDLWKVYKNSSTDTVLVEAKGGGYSPNKWSKISAVYSQGDFANSGSFSLKKWYVPKPNGDPPDALLDEMMQGNSLAQNVAKSYGAKLPPSATTPGVYIPGKTVGQQVHPFQIVDNWHKYPDGQIIATHTNFAGDVDKRVVKVSGKVAVQTKSKTGTWVQTKEVENTLSLPSTGVWKASDSMLNLKESSAAQTALQKAALKKAGPPTLPPKATVALPPPSPPGVYYTGKKVEDKISSYDVFQLADWKKSPDGQIIAIKEGYAGYYSSTKVEKWRLVKIDGKLIQQTKTKAGVWTQTKIIQNSYDVEYGNNWILKDQMLSAADDKKLTNAVKKIEAKKTAPPPIKASKAAKVTPSGSSSYAPPITNYVAPHVDITPWNDVEQKEMFDYIRGQNIYTSASPDSMWGAIQAAKQHFQTKYGGKYTKLNEIELLRIVDEQRALKKGIPNGHWYEGKVMQWLQTPAGKAYVNKRIDAPIAAIDVPVPMEDFASGPPMDSQTYPVLTKAQSQKNRDDALAKYGAWGTGQKSALRDYTGGVSGTWNSAIRKGDLGSYKAKIIAMQQGMRPSVRPMTLHRGTDFTEFNDPTIRNENDLKQYVGSTYINRGFNSASFGGRAGFSSKSVILEIECPIGTPMSHAADYSHYPSENEVTLATHLVYQILDVRKSGHQTFVRVRVIGVGQP